MEYLLYNGKLFNRKEADIVIGKRKRSFQILFQLSLVTHTDFLKFHVYDTSSNLFSERLESAIREFHKKIMENPTKSGHKLILLEMSMTFSFKTMLKMLENLKSILKTKAFQ